jgi:hypothetical protein
MNASWMRRRWRWAAAAAGTLAASAPAASGHALFSDIQAIPDVTDAEARRCDTALGRQTFSEDGLPVLDASRPSCALGSAAGKPHGPAAGRTTARPPARGCPATVSPRSACPDPADARRQRRDRAVAVARTAAFLRPCRKPAAAEGRALTASGAGSAEGAEGPLVAPGTGRSAAR